MACTNFWSEPEILPTPQIRTSPVILLFPAKLAQGITMRSRLSGLRHLSSSVETLYT